MELLIAGGIALAGYRLSQTNAAPTRSFSKRAEGSYPFPDAKSSADMKKMHEEAAAQRWKDAQNPAVTGVISPNADPSKQMPFFTSASKQHSNNAMKQRRMEMLTGVTGFGSSATGTYQKKTEGVQLFEPQQQQVRSSGTSGNPANYSVEAAKTALVSGIQTMVSPVQQVRVGPGIGVDPSIAAANDGFHPMFRVMPDAGRDLGAYRRNQLPGGVVHGKSVVPTRAADLALQNNAVPRVWDYERRPPEATRATVTAPTPRPALTACVNGRVVGDEYYGPSTLAGPHASGSASARNKRDDTQSLPLTNATSAWSGKGGQGAYVGAGHDLARHEAQHREASSGHLGNLRGDQHRQTAPGVYVMPPTSRDLTAKAYNGVAKHYVSTATTHVQDNLKKTLRQTQLGPTQGSVAPRVQGPRIQCTDKQLLKESKRGVHRTEGYVAGVQRNTAYRAATGTNGEAWCGDAWARGQSGLRNDDRQQRVMGHAETTAVKTFAVGGGRATTPLNRLPENNQRLDLLIARDQLQENPYKVTVV